MTTPLNPYISWFDADFDVEKSSHYRMTIQFSLDGFSYALLDLQSNALVGLENFQSEALTDSVEAFHALERALAAKGLDGKGPDAVTCLIDNRCNTLVPADLFDEHEAAGYLDFAFQASGDQIILNETLGTERCVNVFAMSKSLYQMIKAKWEKARIRHTSSVFLDSVVQYAPEGRAAFVNVKSRNFDLAIVNEGRLDFFNNFRFNTKDDFAYFLIFALEQNHFSYSEHPVCFSGLILPESNIIELCKRYIKYLLFVEDRAEVPVSEALAEVPFQYYFIHYQALR